MNEAKKPYRGLLIEDSIDTSELVTACLQPDCKLDVVTMVKEGIEHVAESAYQFFLVDLNLPDGSGFEFCKFIRENSSYAGIPLFILTAESSPEKELEGFEAGALDYIKKPFTPTILKARILKRVEESQKVREAFQLATNLGTMYFDLFHGTVYITDPATHEKKNLGLTATEFRLLYTFANEQGHLLTRDELQRRVWGSEVSKSFEQHLMQLRKKLGQYSQFIETKYGEGYISDFVKGHA